MAWMCWLYRAMGAGRQTRWIHTHPLQPLSSISITKSGPQRWPVLVRSPSVVLRLTSLRIPSLLTTRQSTFRISSPTTIDALRPTVALNRRSGAMLNPCIHNTYYRPPILCSISIAASQACIHSQTSRRPSTSYTSCLFILGKQACKTAWQDLFMAQTLG
jgi:hypothetical protein